MQTWENVTSALLGGDESHYGYHGYRRDETSECERIENRSQ